MVIFDPYSDRLARDIRNSLSSALVNELTGNADGKLAVVADDWLSKGLAPIYQTYIQNRLSIYRRAIDEIRAGHVVDPRYQAIYLWNLGLFFEMHEILETIWLKTREPERSALKGWIQAAGVYVHFKRGNVDAARGLARKAELHLRKGRSFLGFISNLDQLIEAISDPTDVAPQIISVHFVNNTWQYSKLV
jgi:hypothetical protein